MELVKSLFQRNLLSKRTVPQQSELTIEAMVRAILPGMNKPSCIEEDRRNGVIRRTHCEVAHGLDVLREQPECSRWRDHWRGSGQAAATIAG